MNNLGGSPVQGIALSLMLRVLQQHEQWETICARAVGTRADIAALVPPEGAEIND